MVVDGEFCKENSCVDKALKEIYSRDSKSKIVDMDCYIYLCGFLSQTALSEGCGCLSANRSLMFSMECVCREENHRLRVDKQGGLLVADSWSKMLHRGGDVHLPLSCMVLCRQDAPQYCRLPDLGRYISAVLQKHHVQHMASKASCLKGVNKAYEKGRLSQGSVPSKKRHVIAKGCNIAAAPVCAVSRRVHGLCSTILQESIPCLKRCKRSNRPMRFIRELCSSEEVGAIINSMHGTLLALYPRSVHTQSYPCRVQLAWRLREIMSTTLEEQVCFLEKNMGLVKLCLMEYCNNVIPDFLTPEHRAICAMQPGSELFEGVCSSICNTFRRTTLLSGTESWESLNMEAHVYMDRCVRMCRFKVPLNADVRPKQYVDPATFQRSILKLLDLYGCISAMRQAYQPGSTLAGGSALSEEELYQACIIQRSVRCFELPKHVGKQQWTSASSAYGSCVSQLCGACCIHICLVCAANGKKAWPGFRMCSETGDLSCTVCKVGGTVVKVNMIGQILRILDTSYYMCPTCLQINEWRGDGMDLSTDGEGRCRCEGLRAQEDQYASSQRVLTGICSACGARHISSNGVSVVSTSCMSMDTIHLCSRHMPHAHVLKRIFDRQSLESAVASKVMKQVSHRGQAPLLRR